MKKTMRTICFSAAASLLLCLSCAAADGYRIGEKEGRVAVWDCSRNCWSQVTDVPVSSLPEADRASLEAGISAATAAEAAALLEDYCG